MLVDDNDCFCNAETICRPSQQQSSIFLVPSPSCSLYGTPFCLLDPLWISALTKRLADNYQLETLELGGTLTGSEATMTIHDNRRHDDGNQQDANTPTATSPWPPPDTIEFYLFMNRAGRRIVQDHDPTDNRRQPQIRGRRPIETWDQVFANVSHHPDALFWLLRNAGRRFYGSYYS